MLFFLIFRFGLSKSFIQEIDNIQEPIIDVPISVVFIGKHQLINPEIIQTEFTKKWFENLRYTRQQEIKRGSSYFHSSTKSSKYPPIKYHFHFSLHNVSDDDNHLFEDAFQLFSRSTTLNPSPNQKIFATIHPYPIHLLLHTYVDYYKIDGYVFFAFASNGNTNYQICEGINYQELNSITTTKTKQKNRISVKIDHSKPWNRQIKEKLNDNSFGNWSTAEEVYHNFLSNPELTIELNNLSTPAQCSPNWVMSNKDQDRIFFSDISNIARFSYFETFLPSDSVSISDKLNDAVSSFDQLCNVNKSVTNNYCQKLESYISDLRVQVKAFGSDKSIHSLHRFLSNASTLILDALNKQVAPSVPLYDLQMPDVFEISVTQIGKASKAYNITEIKGIFENCMINNIKPKFDFTSNRLNDFPMLAIPVFYSTYRQYMLDDYFQSTFHRNNTSSSYKSPNSPHLYEISNQLFVEAAKLEEALQFKSLNIKAYRNTENKVVRNIVSIVLFPDSNDVYNPLLIDGNVDSFSFDQVSLYIAKNIDDTVTEMNSTDKKMLYTIDPLYVYNYHFDPNRIVRSSLIHMYGILPSKKWRSLSIMCPLSQHRDINLVSKDVAYRNSISTELSKTKIRVMKHANRMIQLLQFAHERAYDMQSIHISEDKLVALTIDLEIQYNEVIKQVSNLQFEELVESVEILRNKRKLLTNSIKSTISEVELALCELAPVHLIVKNPSLIDRLDNVSTLLSPIWIGLLVLSVLAASVVYTNRLKYD